MTKPVKWMMSALLLGTFLPLSPSLIGQAATTTAPTASVATNANTTADVQVAAGKLTFAQEKLPALKFEAAKVADGEQTGLGLVKTDNAPVVKISNLLGSGEPWQLKVSLSEFQAVKLLKKASSGADDKRTLTGATLVFPKKNLTAKAEKALPTATTTTPVRAGADAMTLIDAGRDAGMGAVDLDLSPITLTLPRVDYAGNYQATVTYSLVSGPNQ